MSDSVWPHRRQPTRLPCPWDSAGKNTGVGCHFLLQGMKVKSESEVAQSCLTLSDPTHGLQPTRLLRPWNFTDIKGPKSNKWQSCKLDVKLPSTPFSRVQGTLWLVYDYLIVWPLAFHWNSFRFQFVPKEMKLRFPGAAAAPDATSGLFSR